MATKGTAVGMFLLPIYRSFGRTQSANRSLAAKSKLCRSLSALTVPPAHLKEVLGGQMGAGFLTFPIGPKPDRRRGAEEPQRDPGKYKSLP